MSLSSDMENQRRAAEQAAEWLLILQSEEFTPVQHAAFVDWLRESPVHVSELLRTCQLQHRLSRFKGWRQLSPTRATSPAKVMRLVADLDDTGARPATHRLRNVIGLAASLAVLSIIGWLSYARLGSTEFSTQMGERREMTLADGSLLDLAPDSEVVVRYRQRERLIALNRGRALFRVAKNPNRPFIVQAASTRVRAV